MRAVPVLVRVERIWSFQLQGCCCCHCHCNFIYHFFGLSYNKVFNRTKSKTGGFDKKKYGTQFGCAVRNAQPFESFKSYRCAVLKIHHSIQLISAEQIVDVFDSSFFLMNSFFLAIVVAIIWFLFLSFSPLPTKKSFTVDAIFCHSFLLLMPIFVLLSVFQCCLLILGIVSFFFEIQCIFSMAFLFDFTISI